MKRKSEHGSFDQKRRTSKVSANTSDSLRREKEEVLKAHLTVRRSHGHKELCSAKGLEAANVVNTDKAIHAQNPEYCERQRYEAQQRYLDPKIKANEQPPER